MTSKLYTSEHRLTTQHQQKTLTGTAKHLRSRLTQEAPILQIHVLALTQEAPILKIHVSTLTQEALILEIHVSVLSPEVLIPEIHVSTLTQKSPILQIHVSAFTQKSPILQIHVSALTQKSLIPEIHVSALTQKSRYWRSFNTYTKIPILEIRQHLHKNPRYLRSMSRHSVCSLMASRMESDDTSPVSRTTLSSWFMVMRGRRTASRMGVGSAPWLCSAHSHTAWKMSISCAQKESLRMRSRTDICNARQKQAYLK